MTGNEHILILDDEPAICRAFQLLVQKLPFVVTTATSPDEALEALSRTSDFAVIIADYNLPGMTGLQFLDLARQVHPFATQVLISGQMDLGMARDAVNRHSVHYLLPKPWSKGEIFDVIERGMAAWHTRRKEHDALVSSVSGRLGGLSPNALSADRKAFMDGLVDVLGARDTETRSHSRRVAAYALKLGLVMGLNPAELTQLEVGSLLHDIGKMGIPDRILLKPGSLDDAEWREMRKHPQIGLDLVRKISLLEAAEPVVAQHHERFDGKGYPRGIAGHDISIQARIFAVVDTFDAITSDRPYRARLPFERAVTVVTEEQGKQFDPQVAAAFLEVPRDQWEVIRCEHEDSREELTAVGADTSKIMRGFIDSE